MFSHPSNLNVVQKNIIEATVNFYLEDIGRETLSPDIVIKALQFIFKQTLDDTDIQLLSSCDVLDAVKNMRHIVFHPCPENGTAGPAAKQGLLGLTGRNDETARPVTRDAVIIYISQLTNQLIAAQAEKLGKSPEEFVIPPESALALIPVNNDEAKLHNEPPLIAPFSRYEAPNFFAQNYNHRETLQSYIPTNPDYNTHGHCYSTALNRLLNRLEEEIENTYSTSGFFRRTATLDAGYRAMLDALQTNDIFITAQELRRLWIRPVNPHGRVYSHTESDAIIYLVRGQVDDEDLVIPDLPPENHLTIEEAFAETAQLTINQIQSLIQCYQCGLRGDHLRQWQPHPSETDFSDNHTLALFALITEKQLSPEAAILKINGITEAQAQEIYDDINDCVNRGPRNYCF